MGDITMNQAQSEDDPYEEGYLEGMRHGLRDGRIDGQDEGRKEGIKLGKADVLFRLLDKRFGFVPLWARTQVAKAEEQQIEDWAVAMLSATSFDDVFGPYCDSF